MEINNQEILYPEKKKVRTVITEPRRTLYELCVICVHNHLHTVLKLGMLDHLMEDKVHALPLPQHVVKDLLKFDSNPPSPLVEKYVNVLKKEIREKSKKTV